MSEPAKCQGCRHWKPLYSGEQWGVRSFADAPAAERERVLAEIRARHDAQGYGWEAGDAGPWPPMGTEVDAPPGPEWPMWGDCALTEMGQREAPSLARAMDGSEYMAVLRCHATFGCVQWAAQEPEADKARSP